MTSILNLNLKDQFLRLENIRGLSSDKNNAAFISNTIIECIEDVTGVYGFTGKNKSPINSEPRFMLFYIMHVIGFTHKAIGAATDLHHTSVISGIRKHRGLMGVDRKYKNQFEAVVNELPEL